MAEDKVYPNDLLPGERVRFKVPATKWESELVFEVLENRRNRVLVREVLQPGIRRPTFIPEFCYLASELERISHD